MRPHPPTPRCRYGYYLAASLGYRLSALKPLVTLSQMVQFCVFIAQVGRLGGCESRGCAQAAMLGAGCATCVALAISY